MFTVIAEKGFQLSFENGITISVMFGSGNYCENKSIQFKTSGFDEVHKSKDAEVYAWKGDDNVPTVRGWMSANNVAKAIQIASEAKCIDDCEAILTL